MLDLSEKHSSVDTNDVTGTFLEQDTAVAQHTMQLNYFGTHNVLKAVLPRMVQRNSGHAVIISSGVALCGACLVPSACPAQ